MKRMMWVILSAGLACAQPSADTIPGGTIGGVHGGVIGGVPGGVPGGVIAGLSGDFAFFAQPGRARSGDEGLYERGQRALDRKRYDEALEAFGSVASGSSSRADAALYWKAYTQAKLGRRDDAKATLAEFRKNHPQSRWLDDAKALEQELSGGGSADAAGGDEELKLMALMSLMQSDPDRALPVIEKMLQSTQSPKVKERALFVLMQTGSPKAKQLVSQLAKGGGNPDLQIKAIQFLGIMHAPQELGEIYASAKDNDVKRAVLRGFLIAQARDQMLQAAKDEKDTDLKLEAIRMVGVMGMRDQLWQLYQGEADVRVKKEVLRGLFLSGNPEKLLELAKGEKDAALRREAVRNLGLMKKSAELGSLYAAESDPDTKKEIVRAMFLGGNAKQLVDLAKTEKDPEMKREIVRQLSLMKSKEATDYMMELLK